MKPVLVNTVIARSLAEGETTKQSQQEIASLTSFARNDKVSTQIIKQVLLPEIEKEVNHGKNFAPLRQIFHSMILAMWYKKKLKNSLFEKIYLDQNKTGGIELEEKDIKEKIYNQYLEAFKKGVYDYVKEDYDPQTQEIIERKYFSGGVRGVDVAMLNERAPSQEWVEQQKDRAHMTVSARADLIRGAGSDSARLSGEASSGSQREPDRASLGDEKLIEEWGSVFKEIIEGFGFNYNGRPDTYKQLIRRQTEFFVQYLLGPSASPLNMEPKIQALRNENKYTVKFLEQMDVRLWYMWGVCRGHTGFTQEFMQLVKEEGPKAIYRQDIFIKQAAQILRMSLDNSIDQLEPDLYQKVLSSPLFQLHTVVRTDGKANALTEFFETVQAKMREGRDKDHSSLADVETMLVEKYRFEPYYPYPVEDGFYADGTIRDHEKEPQGSGKWGLKDEDIKVLRGNFARREEVFKRFIRFGEYAIADESLREFIPEQLRGNVLFLDSVHNQFGGIGHGLGYALPYLAQIYKARDLIKDANILEFGIGRGIAALFAIKLGAKRVVGIEKDPALKKELQKAMKANGIMEDKVAFIEGDFSDTGIVEKLKGYGEFQMGMGNIGPHGVYSGLPKYPEWDGEEEDVAIDSSNIKALEIVYALEQKGLFSGTFHYIAAGFSEEFDKGNHISHFGPGGEISFLKKFFNITGIHTMVYREHFLAPTQYYPHHKFNLFHSYRVSLEPKSNPDASASYEGYQGNILFEDFASLSPITNINAVKDGDYLAYENGRVGQVIRKEGKRIKVRFYDEDGSYQDEDFGEASFKSLKLFHRAASAGIEGYKKRKQVSGRAAADTTIFNRESLTDFLSEVSGLVRTAVNLNKQRELLSQVAKGRELERDFQSSMVGIGDISSLPRIQGVHQALEMVKHKAGSVINILERRDKGEVSFYTSNYLERAMLQEILKDFISFNVIIMADQVWIDKFKDAGFKDALRQALDEQGKLTESVKEKVLKRVLSYKGFKSEDRNDLKKAVKNSYDNLAVIIKDILDNAEVYVQKYDELERGSGAESPKDLASLSEFGVPAILNEKGLFSKFLEKELEYTNNLAHELMNYGIPRGKIANVFKGLNENLEEFRLKFLSILYFLRGTPSESIESILEHRGDSKPRLARTKVFIPGSVEHLDAIIEANRDGNRKRMFLKVQRFPHHQGTSQHAIQGSLNRNVSGFFYSLERNYGPQSALVRQVGDADKVVIVFDVAGTKNAVAHIESVKQRHQLGRRYEFHYMNVPPEDAHRVKDILMDKDFRPIAQKTINELLMALKGNKKMMHSLVQETLLSVFNGIIGEFKALRQWYKFYEKRVTQSGQADTGKARKEVLNSILAVSENLYTPSGYLGEYDAILYADQKIILLESRSLNVNKDMDDFLRRRVRPKLGMLRDNRGDLEEAISLGYLGVPQNIHGLIFCITVTGDKERGDYGERLEKIKYYLRARENQLREEYGILVKFIFSSEEFWRQETGVGSFPEMEEWIKTGFSADLASLGEAPGGIDFNARHLDLKEQGQETEIHFSFDQFENIQPNSVNGILPVIINIIPVTNFPLLLGLSEENQKISALAN